jgi:hypothetical protein
MPYFIESPSVKHDDYLKLNSVEELTLLDQACGSGHILVYGFDLLYKIYEEEGYNTNEIPELIIKNNLFGFEIDERASQLAGMALMMKARSYNRRFFRKEVEPTILCYKDLVLTKEEYSEAFHQIGIKLSDELNYDLTQMKQATNYGSLIAPHTSIQELEKTLTILMVKENTTDAFLKYQLEQLRITINQLVKLSRKYHCLVANPPYMGGGKMNTDLSNFVKINYPDAKADLITCFIERGIMHLPKHGFSGLVTMESWMFLSSFETFRKKLVENSKIHSLSHFGWHIMRIAFGTVSFILENSIPNDDFKGTYSFMENDNIEKETERPINFPVKDERYKILNQKKFKLIPGSPIGYWLNENAIKNFQHGNIGDIGVSSPGIRTGKDDCFIRFWTECNLNDVLFNGFNLESLKNEQRWFPITRGGEFRKWYGNNDFIVNWEQEGRDLYSFENSVIRNPSYYFTLNSGSGFLSFV